MSVCLALLCAFLSLTFTRQACAQPPARSTSPVPHNILIAGGLDYLRVQVANEVRRQLATDVRSTAIRLIPARAIDDAEMPEHRDADMPLDLLALRELGKLLRADMLVALAIERTDSEMRVELTVVAPIQAAPRIILRTRARSVQALSAELARAIRADSAYRRLRASGP